MNLILILQVVIEILDKCNLKENLRTHTYLMHTENELLISDSHQNCKLN